MKLLEYGFTYTPQGKKYPQPLKIQTKNKRVNKFCGEQLIITVL
jgi:hypothetical protein